MSFSEIFASKRAEIKAGFVKDLKPIKLEPPLEEITFWFTRETAAENLRWNTFPRDETVNQHAVFIAVRAKTSKGEAMFKTDEEIKSTCRDLMTLEPGYLKAITDWVTREIDVVSDKRYEEILGNLGKTDS